MKSGKGALGENLLVLLMRSVQEFRADIEQHLDTTSGVPRVLRELNGAERRLLTLIPAEGARGTDLADRAGMSKQALGQLAAGLEEAGLVHAETDPSDRRARIWKLTGAGGKSAAAARATIEAVEARWSAHLGQRDYERLIAILRRTSAPISGRITEPAPPQPARHLRTKQDT